ncbi:TM2 domain protein [Jeotgalicoccus meleagridis]|uniref:TM2 domain protein n=1 Tax=Jeotgalicoccus meleagridis TaxID=2759181 RepID=A0A6V7R9X4_9STAP|nr:TM2 domain protein [Jeotgalicoccus meleagridis]
MPGEKNAGIAAVLSFFVTGLGQIYNGQIFKGILLILIQIVNGLLLYILIGFITMPIVWLYGVINAYRHAERINRRLYNRH